MALPKIVITADKRETLEENVAASVSVITRKDIEAQVGTTVPEVLRNLAGVNVQSIGAPGDDTNLRIRGSDQDEVLVLLDGVPINNIREHRTQFLGDIPLEIVERIEVVRGPQSVLYGSDAVGGVVNIITRKGTKRNEVPVSFEGGNLGTFREVLGVSGSSKKTQYFTNFTRMDQKGAFPHNAFGGWTLDGSFSYRFTPNVEMNVGATYLSNNQDLYYEFISTFDPDLGSLLVKINPDGNNALHRDMLVAHANVKATIRPWWNLELLYGLFIDQDSNFNSDVGDTAPPPFVPGAQDFQGSGVEHTADLRNVFNLHQSKNFVADFLLGFEFQQESLKFNDLVSGVVFPDTGQKGSRQNYAPYFLFHFGFLDQKLLVSGGARYDHNTTFGNEWSPRGSLIYKLEKTGTRFRASYGEGFHGPTILDFFTEVLQQQLGLPFQAARLQAELSRSYEGGVDQKLGKWGEIGASFYYTQYHHLFDELQFINNAYVLGTEIELEMHPLKRLRFGGNYTFMHTRNQDNGMRLADRPNQQGNIFVEGKPLDKLLLRLDVDIVGNRLIPNTLSTAMGDIPFIFIDLNGVPEGGSFAAAANPQGAKLGAYTTANFAATYNIAKDRWHMKNWKVYGKVMNLFNARYQQKFGFFEPGITFLLGTQATF